MIFSPPIRFLFVFIACFSATSQQPTGKLCLSPHHLFPTFQQAFLYDGVP
jgi:hypothetical protein